MFHRAPLVPRSVTSSSLTLRVRKTSFCIKRLFIQGENPSDHKGLIELYNRTFQTPQMSSWSQRGKEKLHRMFPGLFLAQLTLSAPCRVFFTDEVGSRDDTTHNPSTLPLHRRWYSDYWYLKEQQQKEFLLFESCQDPCPFPTCLGARLLFIPPPVHAEKHCVPLCPHVSFPGVCCSVMVAWDLVNSAWMLLPDWPSEGRWVLGCGHGFMDRVFMSKQNQLLSWCLRVCIWARVKLDLTPASC